MKKNNPLLAAMLKSETEAAPEPEAQRAPLATSKPKSTATRAGQKHLGAYFDKGDPILERVAVLRARLDMTNSELIEYALNELWARHEAGRAFGD